MADATIKADGDDSFIRGMNGFVQPQKLPPGYYQQGVNAVSRGGIFCTRPGSQTRLNKRDLPSGNIQGCHVFTPSSSFANGIPQLMVAIDGYIYVSPYPFVDYERLEGVKFSAISRYVSWTDTVQSTDFTPDGVLYALPNPKAICIMQDGITRAAQWDGGTASHVNPTPSGTDKTKPGFDGTVIGLWSYWSNNRLWVSRGNQVFASDLGNPLKFTDTQYIAEGRAFYLSGDCTGITETADKKGIICFTENDASLILSSIQDRTTWLNTPDFQKTILPNIGCVAPRSIVQQYGLIWWYTSKGLINLDDALNANITSRLNVQDNPMFQTKWKMGSDLSGVCGTYIENYLLEAVPYANKANNRIFVLDQSPIDGTQPNAFPSYWQGWYPREFARLIKDGTETIYCASLDDDGVNRVWELMRPEKTDNGIPITSWVVTREHLFESRDWKKFRYASVEFANITDDTAVMVAVNAGKGAYQRVLTKDIAAMNGQVYANSTYGFENHELNGSIGQTRTVLSQDDVPVNDCNDSCVESDKLGLIGKAFSLYIVWSGVASVNAYQIFTQWYGQAYIGTCELDETNEARLLTPHGCGEASSFSSKEPFETFYATVTYKRRSPFTGDMIAATIKQSSFINQQDAYRKAYKYAECKVLRQIGYFNV